MTDEKKWPLCQTTAPETTIVRHYGEPAEDFQCTPTGRQELPQSDLMRLPAVHYIRADLADQWRNERDELQRRIDGAPQGTATRDGVVRTLVGALLPGKRVALVLLGDEK